jgi:PAS domain S-box-containing protein
MFDTVVDVTIPLDEDGTIQAVAETDTAKLGHSSEQLSGKSITSILPRDEFASQFDVQSSEEFESLVLGAEADGTRVPVQTAAGDCRTVKLWTVSRPDAGGPVCFGRVVADSPSTAQTTTGDELLNAVADPLYVLDSKGRFERVNDALVAYTGYDRDEILGRSMVELLPVSTYERTTARLLEVVEDDNETTTFEMSVITNDGERILTEANVTVLTDEAGTYAGSVGVLRDIRERKHREQNLDLLKQVLARVFRHNVRNELTVVKGHAEMLERRVDDDQQAHASEILETADRLLDHSEKARLIEDVVEFHEQCDVNLGTMVHSTVDTIRDEYPEATIETDLPSEAVVQAHPDIGSAVEELLDNAIRHAQTEEKARVEVWLDQREDVQTLFVEDKSGGLADHEIDVLEKGGENDLQHSSGVGLWLVRWLVEYSNAEMVVHRTDSGSLMGIRFTDQTPAEERPADVVGSSLEDAPAHVRDVPLEQFQGDTVVGRIEPLTQLAEHYESLEESGGHSVLVKGEAGIGKTTLVEQFRDNIHTGDTPPLIATGYCDSEVQPAYQAFRHVLADLPTDRNVSEILSDAASLSADDAEELQQRKRDLFADIANELREVAGDQPVVLLVEDMQWADQGTIDLFEYLVEEVGRWGHPVMFVGTYRTSDVEESHPILEIADETAEAGRGTVLELEAFGTDEIDSLLSHMLDVEALPGQFTEAVAEHTGGTPLFVSELGRHLVDTLGPVQTGSDLPDSLDEIAVPETVERAITERLESLPEAVWPVLRLGAVIGRTFSFDLLREASDQPTGKLIEDSDTLVRREIWEQSADGITFSHGLVREQTLAQLHDEQREMLHATVAGAIETVHGDALDEHAGRLGHHYEQVSEYETALEYYRQAANYAAENYANDDAVKHYERALGLAQDHDVADKSTRTAILENLGEVFERRAEYDRAREYYQECLELSREIGDRKGEASGLHGLGNIAYLRGAYDQAREYYEESLTLSREIEDRKGVAAGLHNLGHIDKHRAEYDRAREYYEEGLTLFREIGDHSGEAATLSSLGIIAEYRGAYDQAREYYEESLTLFREIGDHSGEATTLSNLGNIAEQRGAYDRAREYYEEGLALSRESEDRRGEAINLYNLGLIARYRGAYDRAKECCQESLALCREIGDRTGEADSLHNLGTTAMRCGAYDRATGYYEESLALFREIGDRTGEASSLSNLGTITAYRNNPEQATQFVVDALEIARELAETKWEVITLRKLGAVTRQLEAYDEAETYLADALDVCDTDEHQNERAQTHLERARLALDRDDIETAREAVERAHSTFAELGATHLEARATLVRGRLAARTNSPDEACNNWQDTLDTFEDVGAPQDALKALGYLVETYRQHGETAQADEYKTKAQKIYERAPEPVQEYHGAWLDC